MYASITKSAIVAFALTGIVVAAPNNPYPNKCGDTVCPTDKPLCCSILSGGQEYLQCTAGTTCPPLPWQTTTMATVTTSTTPPPSQPTFGPKCGDSFFCKPGQVCCTLYTCADTPEQCPKSTPI